MAGRKLTAEELAGIEEIPATPAPAAAPRKLSAADIEGATEIQAEPPADGRSFLTRAADTIKGGARAVAHVGGEIGGHIAEGLKHPIDSLLHPVAFASSAPLADPAKRRELERGVSDMVTLGYGQKLAARVGNALGDAPEVAIGPETFGGGSLSSSLSDHGGLGSGGAPVQNTQASDAEAAPGYRTVGSLVGSALPGAAGALGKATGKLVAPLARAVAPAGEALVSKVAGIPFFGKAAAPVVAGGLGATKSLVGYEAAAPLTAALSADAEGHRHEAAHAAAVDPAGLLLSGVLGSVPAAAKQVSRETKAAIAAAPAAEGKNLMAGVASGDGMHGRATTKAAKLLDRVDENAVDILRGDKELREVSAKPAKEALPVFHERMDRVGSKLDPNYDVVDKTTGGVSLQNLVNVLDDEAARLGQEPLNEQYVKAVEDIKRSALKAWAPEMTDELRAQKRLQDLGFETHKEIPDVLVPTRKVRAMVTRLQKRGTEVINALNPGEASQMKADMADMMKGFIDAHLDIAAETNPQTAKAVESIRDLNRQYSALASMSNAIEQRGWKETTGAMSAGGHMANLFKHGGAVAAVPMLLHGNIPAAVAAVAAPHALPAVTAGARAATAGASALSRSPEYAAAVDRLARAARSATSARDFVQDAVKAGMGVADARRIYEAAHTHQPDEGASP